MCCHCCCRRTDQPCSYARSSFLWYSATFSICLQPLDILICFSLKISPSRTGFIMSNQNKANGVVDQADVNDWISRFNAAVADSTIITAPAVDNAQPWHSPFFGCLTPINTCKKVMHGPSRGRELTVRTGAITCCVPCVTFGKTHHRSRKDAKLQGYSCINATVWSIL